MSSGKWDVVGPVEGGGFDIQSNAGRITTGAIGATDPGETGNDPAGDNGYARFKAMRRVEQDMLLAFWFPSVAATTLRVHLRAVGEDPRTESYAVAITQAQWRLEKMLPDADPVVLTTVVRATSTTKHWLRFNATSSTLSVKFWADGVAEPGSWSYTTMDSTIDGAGLAAVSIQNGDAAVSTEARVDDVLLTGAVPSIPTPGAPVLSVSLVGRDAVLTWTKPTSGPLGYDLERATVTGSTVGTYSVLKTFTSGNKLGYTDPALTANGTFSYRIRAFNRTTAETVQYGTSYSNVVQVVAPKAGTLLAEDFAGTSAASWDAARWPTIATPSSGGGVDLSSNRGRIATGTSGTIGAATARAVSAVASTTADFDVLSTVEIGEHASAGATRLELAIRSDASPATNSLRLDIFPGSDTYQIRKVVDSSITVLTGATAVGYTMSLGTKIRVRMYAKDSLFKVKLWAAGDTQPTAWTHEYTVDAPTSGSFVVRAVPGATGQYATFFLDDVSVEVAKSLTTTPTVKPFPVTLASRPAVPGDVGTGGNYVLPPEALKGTVNVVWVDVGWKALQSSSGGAIRADNPIDKALAAVATWNSVTGRTDAEKLQVAIRPYAGIMTPDDVKNLGGGAWARSGTTTTTDQTILMPRFWTSAYQAAAKDLVDKLGQKYDGNALVLGIAVFASTPSNYPEVFLREGSDSQYGINLFKAGYTVDLDKATIKSHIDDCGGAFPSSYVFCSFNPYQTRTSTGGNTNSTTFTIEAMNYGRSQLGTRFALMNNSWRYDTVTPANWPSTLYKPMYDRMVVLGSPIAIQEATAEVVGDWRQATDTAIKDLGVDLLELQRNFVSDQTTYPASDLSAYVGRMRGETPSGSKTRIGDWVYTSGDRDYAGTGPAWEPTVNEAADIASKFAMVIVNPGKWTKAAVDAAHEENPDFLVLRYDNINYVGSGEGPNSTKKRPTEWYARIGTDLLRSQGYGNHHIKNLLSASGNTLTWNEDWFKELANQMKQYATSHNYDGVFLDMMGPAPLSGGYDITNYDAWKANPHHPTTNPTGVQKQGGTIRDPRTGASYTQTQYLQDNAYAAKRIKELSGGLVVTGNASLDEHNFTIKAKVMMDAATTLNFGMGEAWFKKPGGSATSFPTESEWLNHKTLFGYRRADGSVPGIIGFAKFNATQPDAAGWVQWKAYTTATVMMFGVQGKHYAMALNKANNAEWPAWFAKDIGVPSGKPPAERTPDSGGVYVRAFTKGVVIANPGGVSKTFVASRKYENAQTGATIAGTTASPVSVSVAGHTGMFLINKA